MIVLLAHCGLFVPAREARISLVDGIFARVGSGDIIAKNQSTFMTEMIEVANIINNATKQSFVIFDELGRGTSTYDGLSLTRSIIEYFAQTIHANVLVATHYHELIALADTHPDIHNFHMGVYDTPQGAVFLKKVLPGGMDKSYGLEVAKLAGINATILQNAYTYLQHYTHQEERRPSQAPSLFETSLSTPSLTIEQQKILALLENLSIEHMTPIQAMQLLIKIIEIKN